jgi:hypothetical protein
MKQWLLKCLKKAVENIVLTIIVDIGDIHWNIGWQLIGEPSGTLVKG